MRTPDTWTRERSPASSIRTAPLTPAPHMSKWKRSVPMIPPVTRPVCTPMRTATSIPSFRAFRATAIWTRGTFTHHAAWFLMTAEDY